MELQDEKQGDILVIKVLGGRLDAYCAQTFKKQVVGLLGDNEKVVVALDDISFVDSSGLGALLSCLREANKRGGDMKIAGTQPPVRAMFELTRMHRVLEIFNTVDEAVQSYSA